MPWKNGGGWTNEVARAPGSDSPAWRVSVAEIDRDGPFSVFARCDRTLIPLSGVPLELQFGHRASLLVDRLEVPVAFSGDWMTACVLHGGPAKDLNVMTQRERYSHAVRIVEQGARTTLSEDGLHFAYALSGDCAGDTWRIEAEHYAQFPGSRVCLISITALPGSAPHAPCSIELPG